MEDYEDIAGMYSGSIKNGIPHGEGFKIYRNNITYKGIWNNGARHGKGILTYGDFTLEVEMDKGTVIKHKLESGNIFMLSKGIILKMNSKIVTDFNGKFYEEKIIDPDGFNQDYEGSEEFENFDDFGGMFEEPQLNKIIFKSGIRKFLKESQGFRSTSNLSRRFEGNMINGEPNGYGKLYIGSKLIYEGEMNKWVFHGKGKLKIREIEITANFVDDLPNGDVEIKSPFLDYKGQMLDGKYHGLGCLECTDFYYKGKFNDGEIVYPDEINYRQFEPTGFGKEYKTEVLKSNGLGDEIQKLMDLVNEFKLKDKTESRNILSHQREFENVLSLLDSQLQNRLTTFTNGITSIFANSLAGLVLLDEAPMTESKIKKSSSKILDVDKKSRSFFENEFIKGVKHLATLFKVKVSQGEYYGEFSNSIMHGKGRFIFNNGEYYEGLWNKGKMHGYGIYKYQNDCIFKGNFINGIKNGRGQLQLKNGLKITAIWVNDILEGEGNIFFNEAIINARWVNGKIYQYGKFKNINSVYFMKFLSI
ncbi:hypothetical protein SteCoe_21051 [Stentor coeruleus]|uniref:MORN repeat protein n=1 Tax=Stentor coeruleus TaxID=5963 RepID=A0A1R2BQN5_9CILI|nr:hypothetical protein SteCoe_21051 [Stentor coeruleus]